MSLEITMLTRTIRCLSRGVRDAVLKTPMERGMRAGYDLLDKLLASL